MNIQTQAPDDDDDEEEEETKWNDDAIRWTEEETASERKAAGKVANDDDAPFDPFKDPDPTDTFSHEFLCNGDTIKVELRGHKSDSDEIWKSTGLTLWRASIHLCNYLVGAPDMLEGKRILELGAGLGLCGILVHKLTKNSFVCLTDGDTDALVFLRKNMEQNRVEGLGNSCRLISRQLLWGRESSFRFLEGYSCGQKYDVILASDIVYAKSIIQPLWETIQTLLNRSPDAMFILAFAKRKVPISIDFVLASAESNDFRQEPIEHDKDGIFTYIFRFADPPAS